MFLNSRAAFHCSLQANWVSGNAKQFLTCQMVRCTQTTTQAHSFTSQHTAKSPFGQPSFMNHLSEPSLLLESGRSWFEIESLFKNKPATIKCSSIKSDHLSKHQTLSRVHLPGDFADRQPYFRISRFNYHSLRQVLLRSGMKRSPMPMSMQEAEASMQQQQALQPTLIRREKEIMEANKELRSLLVDPRYPWNFFWGRHLPGSLYKHFNPFQRVNHFPGTTSIGRKDAMAFNLKRLENRMNWSEEELFYPKTFELPTQREELLADMRNNPLKQYILKPSNSSCGRGIYIINASETNKLPTSKTESFVVQHYIDNPHLINGLKYDLRLYVGVSSFNPLKVFLFPDGLTRFATEPDRKSVV